MAGHSHWANISRKKSIVDAKRSKLWGRLSKAIIVAARLGGGDPDGNIRLRKAIDDAKAVSLPKDNIERAIKRGIGEIGGGNVEEILYEGYGPHGVAILCEIMTDNRNRTASEVRKIFDVHGGKLGETGCVGWMFERKGVLQIPAKGQDEERIMEVALEAGAEDVQRSGDMFEVTCSPDVFQDVVTYLDGQKIPVESADITRVATTTVELDADQARAVYKLLAALDDQDDVDAVISNDDVSAEVAKQLELEEV